MRVVWLTYANPMSEPITAKCPCAHCDTHLEFPVEAAGVVVTCPSCQQETELFVPATGALAPETELTAEHILRAFRGPVPKTRVSVLYQVGLLVVAVTMAILPLIYIAMIVAAGWGVYFWATHFDFLLKSSGGGPRVYLFKLVIYAAPLFAGSVLVLFMIKPLFARRAKHSQPLAVNPEVDPLLHAFIRKVCETVGAPMPKLVDVDCNLNASASFRRGALSLFGNDLVLTIGLPLVAGLTMQQFAGVLAHEFGHFAQGFGMRLTYLIRRVNAWFARVAYERDAWDEWLEEWSAGSEGAIVFIVLSAQCAVGCSRLLLKLLMYFGHLIGCFMLRQMEYDADSYESKVVGSACTEDTFRRIHVLAKVTDAAYKDMRVGWNLGNKLPDNFPAYLLRHDQAVSPGKRTKWEDTMGLDPSGLFDTHPSNGDRIRRARQAGEPGVFHLTAPATQLFANYEVVSKQVTQLHYADDLGIPMVMAKLVPDLGPGKEAEASAAPAEETPPSGKPFGRLKLKGRE
ncbi:MAG: Protease HtpX [Verrucomicrobiota bacterium]